jgi:transcriptional regulator with XRE-family HTH domain
VATGGAPSGETALAWKINRLFETMHPEGREYKLGEVVEGIRAQGGPQLSPAYLWQLRHGVRTNPTKEHLEAIATFFGVSPAYFYDDPAARDLIDRLALADALQNDQVARLALRANGLSGETLAAVGRIIEQARQIEGLGDGGDAATAVEGAKRRESAARDTD